jgi:hypothetical protein
MNTVARRILTHASPAILLATAVSCARLDTKSEVDVKPIEVKPIHITVDVNVRVDRQLDQFFSFEDEAKPTTRPATTTTTTAPATQPEKSS